MPKFAEGSEKRVILLRAFVVLFLFTFLAFAFVQRHENIKQYNRGITLLEGGDYQGAIDTLMGLGSYEDSSGYIEEASNRLKFKEAIILYDAGRLEEALDAFSNVKDVEGFQGAKESEKYIKEIEQLLSERDSNEPLYSDAIGFYENGKYEQAMKILLTLDGYKDSNNIAQECESAILSQLRLQKASTISAGIRFSAGVTENGKIAFAGQGYKGEEEIKSWDDIVSVAVNGEFVLGLKKNGEVVVANGNSEYHANTEGWSDMIAIAAGQQFIVGLRKDGTLASQGYNGYGETDLDDWHGITAISAGWQHVVGLDRDGDIFDENGNVYFAGLNSKKIIAEITRNREKWVNLIAISTGGSSPRFLGDGHVVGLKADGTVIAAGSNSHGQCKVYGEDWQDIIAIAAGDYHTVGLKSDGTVLTTLKSDDDINILTKEVTDAKIVAISAGYGTTLALTEDGHVVGTGYKWQGQLDTADWDKIAHYD